MSTHTRTPSAGAVGTRAGDAFAGTATLARLILRRDRIRIPVWILAVAGTLVGIANSFATAFPTAEDLQARAELSDSPVFIAFNGPGYGLDNYTFGALVANESLYIGVILVALMAVFLTVRHTRAEEESGRSELVRAAAVGRHAATTAVLLVVNAAILVTSALTTVGLAGQEDLDWVGSATYGLSMLAAGLVFTTAALVAAQATGYARGAVGLGTAVLAVTYLVRAVGDVSETGLSWLSPFHWSLATRAFVDERWWPLLLSVALAAALAATATTLSTRRDVGAGLVPPRPGNPTAPELLVRPAGFALRLQRGVLVAWISALLLTGASFGPLSADVEKFAAENEQIQEILAAAGGASLLESWLGMVTLILALLATGFAVQSALRMRGEEVAGRAEPVLATSLSRIRWASGYLTVAAAGSGLTLLAGSLGLGVTAAASQGDASLVPELLGAGIAYLPAVWVVGGVAVALSGLVPRAAAAAWLVLAYGVFVGLLGGVLDMPAAMYNASPFEHVPQLPGEEFTVTPVAVLLALAVALVAAGLAGIRSRDIDMN